MSALAHFTSLEFAAQKLVLDIASGAVVQLAQFMPSHLNCFMRQAPLFC